MPDLPLLATLHDAGLDVNGNGRRVWVFREIRPYATDLDGNAFDRAAYYGCDGYTAIMFATKDESGRVAASAEARAAGFTGPIYDNGAVQCSTKEYRRYLKEYRRKETA